MKYIIFRLTESRWKVSDSANYEAVNISEVNKSGLYGGREADGGVRKELEI